MIQNSMVILDSTIRGRLLRPAVHVGLLAIFLFGCVVQTGVHGQTIRDLPPPPPMATPKPKPTPPPKPPTEEVLDVVKVTSNLVMVPVAVTDPQGNAVQGLTIKDFRLDEEGKPQEISELGDPEQVPLAIALLFDVSSSVSQKGFFAFQQATAAAFLKEVMRPTDKAAVFTITGEATLVQPLTSAGTAATKIQAIPPATTPVATAYYDTVAAAARYLEANSPSNYRRVIISISDGDDNYSESIRTMSVADANAAVKGEQTPRTILAALQQKHRRAINEISQVAQKADVTFYSVNPGGPSVRMNQISNRAQGGLETVAEVTGGTAFIPDGQQDLARVFRQVAAELRGQYLLQYYAGTDAPAGQFRRIAVSVPSRNDVKVRARQGYYRKK
jgi:VWFA-related protein